MARSTRNGQRSPRGAPETDAPLAARGSRIEARRSRHSALGSPRGIVFPMLLGSILIIGIAMGGVAQLWSTQVKREKEAELLFRLGEFRRGILRFQADHNRFPKELKDLLLDTSQLRTRRYLRQVYTDPMTGKADWQLKIQIDRTGTTSGIQDVHSKSEGKPLKTFLGVIASSYKDW